MIKDSNTYGLIGSFENVPTLYHAAAKVRDAGFKCWDTFAPLPIHGMDGAMGLKRSKVPFFTFIGGLIGFCTGMSAVFYMNCYDYPLIVGGKPFFSPIFPFPVFYELTILLGAFGTLLGMFITNRLPRHHHPVFEHADFARASDDGLFLVIESKDPKFDIYETREFLEKIGAQDITPIDHK